MRSEHTGRPILREGRPPTVGFFARLAPEKGLHNLVDAMELVRKEIPDVRLRVGGYYSKQYSAYFEPIRRRTKSWGEGFQYIGSPSSLAEKIAFYESCDVLSVPTEFLEPKGLYVLESLANGTPVVQPAHGSFPELIESTGGGWLAEPKNAGVAGGDADQSSEQSRRTPTGGRARVSRRSREPFPGRAGVEDD